jgi:hypothetical protein
MATNTRNAMCLPVSSQTRSFNEYVSTCRQIPDQRAAENYFSNAKQTFRDSFQRLRAQSQDLLLMGRNTADLLTLSGGTVGEANKQINSLTQRQDQLRREITQYQRMSESADKTFLEDIMHGTPQKEAVPTLQDVALLTFWFGWLIMALVLVAVRWGSPGGSFTAATFTLLLLLIVTLCVYALLRQVA